MVKRTCPICGAEYYSTRNTAEDWDCENCGAKIPKGCESDDLIPSSNKKGSVKAMASNNNSIPDGVYSMYVKDGTVYPMALTEEQQGLFNIMVGAMSQMEPLKVAFKHPMGKAENIVDRIRGEK